MCISGPHQFAFYKRLSYNYYFFLILNKTETTLKGEMMYSCPIKIQINKSETTLRELVIDIWHWGSSLSNVILHLCTQMVYIGNVKVHITYYYKSVQF